MKRNLIISGIVIVLTIVALIIFNRFISKRNVEGIYAEAKKGAFDITVSGTGELIAERSVDILAPEMVERNQQQGGFSGGGGGRGGGGGGMAMGGGSEIRLAPLRITDMVPEGTIVKKGDFIAQLDRTEFDNNLKDSRDRLKTFQTNLEMMILDTAIQLTALRDDIKNQKFLVSEAEMKFRNSKYEAPDVLRQAEISLDKSQRVLEQKQRSYSLSVAQVNRRIENLKFSLERTSATVNDIEDLLNQFTITAPSDGMVIYKRDLRGGKRKVGTMITPFDRVVATIPDLTSMISKTFINEIEISKIKLGLEVEIRIDAFPLKIFRGKVISIANIGEVLPNSDSKVFETQIRIDGSDPALRPSMTTDNKIMIKSIDNVVYIPTECILSGADSITYVYTRNRTKQIVVPGESNDKFTVIENGLKAGTTIYIAEPENHDSFRLAGKDLIPVIREKNRIKQELASK